MMKVDYIEISVSLTDIRNDVALSSRFNAVDGGRGEESKWKIN